MVIKVSCHDNIFKDDIISKIVRINDFTQLTENKNYFDIIIKNDNSGIPIIPSYKKEDIINSQSDEIIIDLITEGYHTYDEDLRPILNNNKTYYLFSNGTWSSDRDNVKILSWNYFLFDYAKRHTTPEILDFWHDREYDFLKEKKFTFVSTIGIENEWRNLLTSKLLSNLKFDNFILNYNGKELKEKSRHYDISYNFSEYDSYQDIKEFYTISASIPTEMYNESSILLVAETNAYDFEEFHLTEKTIKALLVGIPFIVVGSYKFLYNLKKLGFRTYNELWSEEYDNIQNFDQRTDTIVNLLNTFDLNILKNQKEKLIEIKNHNRSNFFNLNNLMKTQLSNIINVLS